MNAFPQTETTRRKDGIETNESSRFVDYTVVSPFEEIASTIERSIITWMDDANEDPAKARIIFEYMGSTLAINFFKTSGKIFGVSNSSTGITGRTQRDLAEESLCNWFRLEAK